MTTTAERMTTDLETVTDIEELRRRYDACVLDDRFYDDFSDESFELHKAKNAIRERADELREN